MGTGVLTISASADGMLSDLNKVEKQATKAAKDISQKVEKAAEGKGGGILGRLFGGAAVGGIAGFAAGAAFAGITEGAKLLAESFEALEEKATGLDKGALKGIRDSLEALKGAGLGLLQKVLTAAAPAIMTLADNVLAFLDKMEPTIDRVAQGFEALIYVGSEVFGVILDGVADVITSVSDWASEITGISVSSTGMGSVVLGVLRVVGKGFAYVWDTLKAGAGVMSVITGVIVEGFGKILAVVGDSITELVSLVESVMGDTMPKGFRDAADAVKGWGDKVEKTGKGLRDWGMKAVGGFGDSADKVDGFFDRVEGRLQNQKDKIAGMGKEADKVAAGKLQLSGANLAGSTGAYSIMAKFQAGNILSGDIPKQQLKQQEKANQILVDIKWALMKQQAREIGAL